MFRLAVAALSTLLVLAAAHAGPVTTADPIYHDGLVMRPAKGSIDRKNGNGALKLRNWTIDPIAVSNGIFPDQEPIVLTLGLEEFRINAGRLSANRNGTVFTYRASAKESPRGIRLLRFSHMDDGRWKMWLVVGGIDLSRLDLQDPVCEAFGLIVGGDDRFSGITLTSPTWVSRRVLAPLTDPPCDSGVHHHGG